MTDREIHRSGTADELADAVATALVDTLARVQADGRVPAVALTGGTIAGRIHERVAAAGATAAPGVDWSRVDVWFGDERFVAADDDDRNDGQARRSLLDHLPFDPARLHPMPASDGTHRDLGDAATAYGDELRSQGSGAFDVVMLGVGPDGHVASLFPGHPQLDVEDAVAVPVTDSPKPPPERISLTFPALNRSREVWFLVSGEGKADAVARALAAGTDVHDVPAVGVHGQERTVWWLDEDAASRL
jgi:6-phosphogluconolactonase